VKVVSKDPIDLDDVYAGQSGSDADDGVKANQEVMYVKDYDNISINGLRCHTEGSDKRKFTPPNQKVAAVSK